MRWDLVGHGSHPIPDDPAVVANQVAHLRRIAASLETQLERLPTEDQAGSLVWDSDAAEGFRRVVAELPRDLGRLKTRYRAPSDALDTFRDRLVATKAEAEEGVRAAEIADDAIRAAEAGVERMEEHARSAEDAADRINDAAEPGAPSAQPEPWSGPNHHAALDAARPRSSNEPASGCTKRCGAFEDASDTTADAIGDAIDDDLKNDDSLWGSIKRGADWVVDNLPIAEIASIAGKIAAVAGVLSLIPIPIFQQLAWVALGASVLVVGATAVVMLDKANDGEPITAGDWVTLGLAVGSVALGGVGRRGRPGCLCRTGHRRHRGGRHPGHRPRRQRRHRFARCGAGPPGQRRGSARHDPLLGSPPRIVSRVLGRTGSAEAAVTTATRGVTAARAAEAEALAAHADRPGSGRRGRQPGVPGRPRQLRDLRHGRGLRLQHPRPRHGPAGDPGRDDRHRIQAAPSRAPSRSTWRASRAHGETRAAGDRGATITPQPVGP